jgi:hypothetical protein
MGAVLVLMTVYHQVWLDDEKDGGSSPEQALNGWKELEDMALAGEKPEPWAGFTMQYTTTSSGGKSLQVKAPRLKKKTHVSFPLALRFRVNGFGFWV